MQAEVEHERFQTSNLVVDGIGLTGELRLLVDGMEVEADDDDVYFVEDDAGEAVALEFEKKPFDPVPTLMINGDEYDLLPPLAWYEWAWVGLPFTLVVIGGCLGGAIGGLSFAANTMLFRSSENPFLKWGGTFLVTVGAFILTFVIAGGVQLAMQ